MQSNNCGKGIGHYLLLVAAEIAYSENIKTLSLDDDSDKARTPSSIYLKAGLNYVECCSNEPEMVCKPFEMLDKYETFVENYVIPGKFFCKSEIVIDPKIDIKKAVDQIVKNSPRNKKNGGKMKKKNTNLKKYA